MLEANLRRHFIAHQSGVSEKSNSKFKCVHCFNTFRNRLHLQHHYTNHHGEKFFEETKTFSSQSGKIYLTNDSF